MAAEIANESQQDWEESSPQMAEAQAGAPIATILPRVSITFLLGSGKRKTLEFEQSDSFATIKERLAREWPTGQFQIFCDSLVVTLTFVAHCL